MTAGDNLRALGPFGTSKDKYGKWTTQLSEHNTALVPATVFEDALVLTESLMAVTYKTASSPLEVVIPRQS